MTGSWTVLGLDLSLTSTGLCLGDVSSVVGDVLTTEKTKLRGPERLVYLRDVVLGYARQADLVVIEGYAYGRPNQAHQVGELGGVIRVALFEEGIDFVTVPPAKVKKYATGKGNANKDQVLASVVHRTGQEMSNDEADAWTLRAMALDAQGTPVIEMPKLHRDALVDIKWAA